MQIISANYMDRSDKVNRWLVREEGSDKPTPKTSVKVRNFKFQKSSNFEAGFGCGTVAAGKVVENFGLDGSPSFLVRFLVRIQFDGEHFRSADSRVSGPIITAGSVLFLAQDGTILYAP